MIQTGPRETIVSISSRTVLKGSTRVVLKSLLHRSTMKLDPFQPNITYMKFSLFCGTPSSAAGDVPFEP